MKLIKNEVGASTLDTIITIVIVLFMFLVITFVIVENKAEHDFKAYFSIKMYQGTSEKNLVKPWVNKRLEELKKIATDASYAVEAIRSEPESLTPEDLKGRLERLDEAKKIKKSAWSDWERACSAARWEGYVQACEATK